jgi:hypothetical protein
LLNDDGGVEGENGGRILESTPGGVIKTVVGLDRLPPVVGFDIAPTGFGDFAGQIFVLSQQRSGMPGALENHLVQRIKLADGRPVLVCELPQIGNPRILKSGFGTEARFGPEGSPFAGRLFTISLRNNTIYQTTADGECIPFVTFDGQSQGQPFYLTFTPDGRSMLVSLGESLSVPPGSSGNPGRIARVAPNGEVAKTYLATGMGRPAGMDFAPEGFGDFAGHLFVASAGELEIPVPKPHRLKRDGSVIRIAPDGGQHLVAEGLVNPMGVRFIHGRLIVNDINGDFIAGGRELPDGFVVEITAR